MLAQKIKVDTFTFSGNYPAKYSEDMITFYKNCPKLEAKNNELDIPLDTVFYLYTTRGEDINFRIKYGECGISLESTICPNIQYDYQPPPNQSYISTPEERDLSMFLRKFTYQDVNESIALWRFLSI